MRVPGQLFAQVPTWITLLCGLVVVACQRDPALDALTAEVSVEEPEETDQCSNSRIDDNEEGLDCGGPCEPCREPPECLMPADCDSRVCTEDNKCAQARCDDRVTNGFESDVDCGGKNDCDRCPVGLSCRNGDDCESGTCSDGTCATPSCEDGINNGTEADIDCGRACGNGCPDGAGCGTGDDCDSKNCESNMCVAPACDDKVLNGKESDVDCGGDCDARCAAGDKCLVDADCETFFCTDGGQCADAECGDEEKNGDETDVDCGGQCDPCGLGKDCGGDSDCASLNCAGQTCVEASCDDDKKNGDETDVDCGAEGCDLCADGKDCDVGSQCESGVCTGGSCQPATCSDQVKNQGESDMDCGAACGAEQLCAVGRMCNSGKDCMTAQCSGGKCESPSCNDGIKNGTETDEDCGGSCADDDKRCPLGSDCLADNDCETMLCIDRLCAEPSCTDKLLNNGETDTDCGGKNCDPCDNGDRCASDKDCGEGLCVNKVCKEVDQCNNTPDCVKKYPDATDCADSRKDSSYCVCGTVRCNLL